MASDEVDTVQTNSGKSGIAGKWRGFRRFLYNRDKKTVMDRTGASWGKIGIFYLIFYSCLAAFFAMLLAIFFATVDDNYPKWSGHDSLLKNNPGLGFQPMPDHSSTLIKFTISAPSTYKKYSDYLSAYMQQYVPPTTDNENVMDCSGGRPDADETKVCEFDVNTLSPCTAANQWGYSTGKPCILLKLNRVYNWKPQNSTVEIVCTGQNPADRDNQGTLRYWPSASIQPYYFPYLKQKNYLSPVVMLQFDSIARGVLVMMECRAMDPGIEYDRQRRQGSVRFELQVDN